jgi:hypothetical protein
MCWTLIFGVGSLATNQSLGPPKRTLADLAVKALWHSANNIPKQLTHKQIENQMQDWITVYCKRNNRPRPDISSDTLRRATGRKK